jgi:hypothetical protein
MAPAMRLHAGRHEVVYGVDIGLQSDEISKTLQTVLGSCDGVSLSEGNSTALAKMGTFQPASFRFIHIDGEHFYNSVRSELEWAERLLRDGGIIAVDDFFNINSACVTQAVFDSLAAHPHALRMFLAGHKTYLAAPRHFARYRSSVMAGFVDFAERGFGEKLMLAQQGHSTEIDYVTVSPCYADFKGMRIGEFLTDPPQF